MVVFVNKIIGSKIIVDSELRTPLCFTANEDGASVSLLGYQTGVGQCDVFVHLQYSTDNRRTWSEGDWDGHEIPLEKAGDKVYIRASQNNNEGTVEYIKQKKRTKFHKFHLTGSVSASGNIQFLLTQDGYKNTIPVPYCFSSLFSGCTTLTRAPLLPANTLNAHCYYFMFHQCFSLKKAPYLPAENLAESCYSWMFYDCRELTNTPTLPATTLVKSCYSYMFCGCYKLQDVAGLPALNLAEYCYHYMLSRCNSLVKTPTLPATTLVNHCYENMFSGSTMISSIDVNFNEWNPTNATTEWLKDAGIKTTETKTFKCPSSLPQTIGNSNIPEGWTIITK